MNVTLERMLLKKKTTRETAIKDMSACLFETIFQSSRT